MKIVLDTNCLLPAIFDNSPYSWLLKAFCENKFSLCCTTEMLEEYGELLTSFYSVEISESVINIITNASNFIPVVPFNSSRSG